MNKSKTVPPTERGLIHTVCQRRNIYIYYEVYKFELYDIQQQDLNFTKSGYLCGTYANVNSRIKSRTPDATHLHTVTLSSQ